MPSIQHASWQHKRDPGSLSALNSVRVSLATGVPYALRREFRQRMSSENERIGERHDRHNSFETKYAVSSSLERPARGYIGARRARVMPVFRAESEEMNK